MRRVRTRAPINLSTESVDFVPIAGPRWGRGRALVPAKSAPESASRLNHILMQLEASLPRVSVAIQRKTLTFPRTGGGLSTKFLHHARAGRGRPDAGRNASDRPRREGG